jgi:hypothetical protein
MLESETQHPDQIIRLLHGFTFAQRCHAGSQRVAFSRGEHKQHS